MFSRFLELLSARPASSKEVGNNTIHEVESIDIDVLGRRGDLNLNLEQVRSLQRDPLGDVDSDSEDVESVNDTVDVSLHVDRDHVQLQNDNESMETFDEGRIFRTIGAAEAYITEFAEYKGFSINVKTSEPFCTGKKAEGDNLRARYYRCRVRNCPWAVWLRRRLSTPFVFTTCKLEHSHTLNTVVYANLENRWILLPIHKTRIGQLASGGFGGGEIVSQLEVEFARSFNKWSVYNYMRSLNCYNHWDDAKTFISNLHNEQKTDPEFYFNYSTDDDLRLDKVFFSFGSSQQEFVRYGHCIGIDATYKTNKFRLPLVTIVALDELGHCRALAFALIKTESSQMYEWILEQLSDCFAPTSSHIPDIVFTDGDLAMAKALKNIFPSTHHHLCAWHMRSNIRKNLSSALGREHLSRFLDAWSLARKIGDAKLAVVEWNRVKEEFNLLDNEYCRTKLDSTFESWSESCLPVKFCGTMRTTVNEAYHSRIKRKVKTTATSLTLLFERLKQLKTRDTSFPGNAIHFENPIVSCWSGSSYSKKKLLKSIHDSFKCNVEVRSDIMVKTQFKGREDLVQRTREDELWRCSCLKNIRIGIPCCHITAVLFRYSGAESITQYCHPFWSSNFSDIINLCESTDTRREGNFRRRASHSTCTSLRDLDDERLLYSDIIAELKRVAAICDCRSGMMKKLKEYMIEGMRKFESKNCTSYHSEISNSTPLQLPDGEGCQSDEVGHIIGVPQILNPLTVRGRGRPKKSRRILSSLETTSRRTKDVDDRVEGLQTLTVQSRCRKCSHCGKQGHDIRTCSSMIEDS